jgi:hypothetical protein
VRGFGGGGATRHSNRTKDLDNVTQKVVIKQAQPGRPCRLVLIRSHFNVRPEKSQIRRKNVTPRASVICPASEISPEATAFRYLKKM